MSPIPFNRPHLTGKEIHYISQAHKSGQLSGNGSFTQLCQKHLAAQTGSCKVLLTHSCTAALEMACLLADLGPGDEVIMPSFTFVSTANAFVLRGVTPVFVDIRPDTLNLDEQKIEAALTPRTKAIVPVHYAGVGCEMEIILRVAKRHGLLVIEDAAHGMWATYKGKELGSMGQMGTLSFHETKNIISGEGGALLINDSRFAERAEILWQKGTDRNRFLQGLVDKYTWMDVGSSFLPSELTAAFLWAQLEHGEEITRRRKSIWKQYAERLHSFKGLPWFTLPVVPPACSPNAHLFYLLARDRNCRNAFLRHVRGHGISALFHYIPLHLSPVGRTRCRTPFPLPVTERVADCMVRLPLFADLQPAEIDHIVAAVEAFVP